MISVFLSSTFQDMQTERDLIQKFVLPQVEQYAHKNYETLNIVDLRWGIDTSLMSDRDAMEKIMVTCTQRIKNSYPYFIALLGKNYGSEIAKDTSNAPSLTTGNTIGITEYEIVTRLGMGRENVRFFLRTDLESIDPRAAELRRRVCCDYPDLTLEYEMSEKDERNKFVEQMVQVICGFIDHKAGSSPNYLRFMNYINSCCESITSRKEYDAKIQGAFESKCRCVLLTGLDGIGKKSILYKYICSNHYMAIGIHASKMIQSMAPEVLYEELYSQLLPMLDDGYSEVASEASYRIKLRSALQYFDRKDERKLFVVLEDMHLLFGRNWTKILLQFPMEAWNNIYLCGTVDMIDQEEEVNTGMLEVSIIPVNYLQMEEKRDVINMMYARWAKELPQGAVSALCNKKASGYPTYLALVVSSMLQFEERDWKETRVHNPDIDTNAGDRIAFALTQYIDDLPGDLDQLYRYLYDRCKGRADGLLIENIWGLIDATIFGLDERNLKEAVLRNEKFNEFEFYHSFYYMSFLLTKDHVGRYTTNNRVDRSGSLSEGYRDNLIDYLSTLPGDDPARLNELPYLYASRSRMNDCLTELFKSRDNSLERQMALSKLMDDYGDELISEVSKMDLSDYQNMEKLCGIMEQVFSGMACKNQKSYILAELLTSKCDEIEDSDINMTHKHLVYYYSSEVARKTGHRDNAGKWKNLARKYMNRMKNISLPTGTDEIDTMFNVVKLHLEVLGELDRTRKCLDMEMPESLCMYALKGVKEKIDQIMDKLNNSSIRKIVISAIHLLESLSRYYELMGDLLMRTGDLKAAKECYILAEDTANSAFEGPSLGHALCLEKIGVVCGKEGNPAEALNYYRRAYEELVQADDAYNNEEFESDFALAICRIAEASGELGDYQEAYRCLKKACGIFEKIYNQSHSLQSAQDWAVCLFKIGELARTAGEWTSEGRESAKQAMLIMFSIYKKTQDPEWEDNLKICLVLYEDLGGKL